MKISKKIPLDKEGQYCINCFSNEVTSVTKNGLIYYHCKMCDKKLERSLVIDNKIIWWVDKTTMDYWHESVGVFVFNKNNEALFFKRTIYPFVFTIPAGHLDVGERPEQAAIRELFEEVGIEIKQLKFILKKDIVGDSCRRGSDHHRWHLFRTTIQNTKKIKINDEGTQPIWLALNEALKKELTIPVREFIKKRQTKLF